MKRIKPYLIGALVMLGVLVMATTVFASPPAATGCFTDTNGHWAETFICWMEELGVVGGYPDGTFRPENRVTRAEVSVMMQNASSITRAVGTSYSGCGLWCVGPNKDVAPGTTADAAPVTIVAPGPGYLVINGVMELDCSNAFIASCVASYGDTYIVIDGATYHRMSYTIDGGSGTAAGSSMTQSHAYVRPVSAGSHTVALRIAPNAGSAGPTRSWTGGINVIFVGFNGSGVAP